MNAPRGKDVLPGATQTPDGTVQTTGNRVEAIATGSKRPDTLKVLALGKVYADRRAPVLAPEERYGEFIYDPSLSTGYSLGFRNPNSNSAVVVEVGHVHYYFDPKKAGPRVMEILKEMGAGINRAGRPVVTIPWEELGITPTKNMLQAGPYMQLAQVELGNPHLSVGRGIDAYIEIGAWMDPVGEDCFHMVPTGVDASMKWLMKKMP